MALTFSNVVAARRKVHSEEFSYWNLSSDSFGNLVDPVLNVDHFRMTGRPFPPRPIAGFSAVTAVLEASPGGFLARDSVGLRARIESGGFYGLVSGTGMVAEERPEPGTACEGIHVSVNLDSRSKRDSPRSFFLESSRVKEWKPNPRIRGRVYLGRLAGAESPVSLPAPFSFFEFRSEPKASVSARVLSESGGLVYVLSGRLRLSSGDSIVDLEERRALGFASGEKEDELLVETIDSAHFLFLSGRRVGEPAITHGGFVMPTPTEIADAIARYRSGKMGRLDPEEG